ncbi:hypothetical protein [Idiomarina sp.]|uniref:hypothetical protein n=1 Tax=Idiomarina sp. TaxID=1874361 RepID=UPI001D969B6D|nr:hypothetical protein [Idiomarina sp.]MCJ8317911.1 hypothetical protein [Idiomarina sp.]NQZ17565.1 hypothetical protein [Idiomarina sp.]
MWIHTFTPAQVQEIHHRLHRHQALPVDIDKLSAVCEEVNQRSRCISHGLFEADAIQVAVDYALTLRKWRWVEDHEQLVDTAFVTALTYLRLSKYPIDSDDPALWSYFESTYNNERLEYVFFLAFTRQNILLNAFSCKRSAYERLPRTELGLDNHRWMAILRGAVDESYERCCLTAPGYVWDNYRREVEEQQKIAYQKYNELFSCRHSQG